MEKINLVMTSLYGNELLVVIFFLQLDIKIKKGTHSTEDESKRMTSDDKDDSFLVIT